jgi:cytoskeletal protein CcmA (bactofilin family)
VGAVLVTAYRARRRDERGMAMVMSLMVCLVVFALGAVWVGIGMHQVDGTAREKLQEQARNAAEAGLNAAMSQLSADASWTGETAQTIPGAQFEVSVTMLSVDPDDPGRLITARGYAPSKASKLRVARQLTQQIELLPTDSFRYALFTAPGGITTDNHPVINGDVYSASDLNLGLQATVSGTVTSLGNLTTSGNSTFNGDIRAAGNINFQNSSTTANANLYAGGNVTVKGFVKGNVQAGGTIATVSPGTIAGSKAQYSPPPPPPAQTLPTFTYDPANYAPVVPQNMTPSAFNTYWAAHKSGISGVFRISCPSPPPANDPPVNSCLATDSVNAPGPNWVLSGDTKDFSATGHPTFTVVSYAGGATPAITMTQKSVASNIELVLYAPNGQASFQNLKTLSGTVYAASVAVGQNFTLTFVPPSVKGFNFAVMSSTHFVIQSGPFREVPFTNP